MMPVRCRDCSHAFVVGPNEVVRGPECPNCGGHFLERDQPSPTHSDFELRDMVDPVTQQDQGGNPLGEGTIVGRDGERPHWRRDNYMHAKTAGPEHEAWAARRRLRAQLKGAGMDGHMLGWSPGMHGRGLFVGPYLHTWDAYDPQTINSPQEMGFSHHGYGQSLSRFGVDPNLIDYSTGVEIAPDGTMDPLANRDLSMHTAIDPRLKEGPPVFDFSL